MKVCILGPVAPFRSGIARHTTALARELVQREGVTLSIVSFSVQYPRVLYPGDSEIDPDGPHLDGIDADFCINSMNPLSWRKALRRVLRLNPELCVIPVWTFFLAPCLGWIARALRRHSIPVTMIVHNAEDHEAARWKTSLSRFQLRQASRFVTHNAAIEAELRRLVPSTPVEICPHPAYDDYPEPEGVLPKRAGFELLFFGLVRSYKGLDIGLRALAEAGIDDVRLSIVGEFWERRSETEALIRQLDLDEKVELVPRYVSDQEAAEYFHRSDVVIAPYRSATGSGVVAMAQWYCRPVLASNVPGLAQAVTDGRTGWLFPAGDVSAMAWLLKTRASRQAADAMQPTLDEVRKELTWSRFADAILGRASDRQSRQCSQIF